MNGLDSFPNLKRIYAANNLISDFSGIGAWLANLTGPDLLLDLRYNQLANDGSLCADLSNLTTTLAHLGGNLLVNPQGNDGGFSLSLDRWRDTPADTVLALVTAVNTGLNQTPSYSICED